jgi:hypothetical protein
LKVKKPKHHLGLPLNRKKLADYEAKKPLKGLRPLRNEYDSRIFKLEDSTSNIMQNLYLIQREDPSFEK